MDKDTGLLAFFFWLLSSRGWVQGIRALLDLDAHRTDASLPGTALRLLSGQLSHSPAQPRRHRAPVLAVL